MHIEMPLAKSEPSRDCTLCPRLVKLRTELQGKYPGWWNAPVPAWGDTGAWLGIIGLAPGMKGANRTGRPFTGDASGDLLFTTLAKKGLSIGEYAGHIDDQLQLKGATILNSVKCLPPQNKPTGAEVANCRQFLTAQLAKLPDMRVFIALGKIAHESFIRHFGLRLADHSFAHGAEHLLPDGRILIDSYHCSRYNTQTKRLTPEMFERIFDLAVNLRQLP